MIRNKTAKHWTGFLVIPLLSAILLTASLRHVAAQDVGDVAAGRDLCETWCSSCHVVSRAPQRGTSNGTPTFTAIARMRSTTPLSLGVFLQTPHSGMPDLHLSRDEIDNITAYILSLRRR